MKAVMCNGGQLEVTELPDPRPGPGQVLLNVSRAGICGSDLHLRSRFEHYAKIKGINTGIVLGHEFSGEIAEYGSDTHRRWKAGAMMVAMPLCRHGRDPHSIGGSLAPGAYAEQVVVQESLTFAAPKSLSAEYAALTEPLSVGWHAVRRSKIEQRQIAYVIGCGPVGLAVILMLKAAGVTTVIASDMSPGRRALAARCGADVVVDPQSSGPFDAEPGPSRSTEIGGGLALPNSTWTSAAGPENLNLAFDTMERLREDPTLAWWQVFRDMHELGTNPAGPVVFDCVGAAGLLDKLTSDAPQLSRIVAIGACMHDDKIRPSTPLLKEMEIRFSCGYNPGEFRDVLYMLAEGKIDPSPLLTGTVGLDGVEAAFDALDNPEKHAKILIDPQSSSSVA